MKKALFVLFLFCAVAGSAQKTGSYTNPILAGFYPDPSICRVGNDYYLVNSSFVYYPGLPVFHSTDLVNWKQLGHAMNRPEQLPLQGAGMSRGLYAPTIRYHNGLFYIVCTLVDRGGNFVITAKNPAGPWSNPVWMKNVEGIDPSLYFDEESGKAFILYNSIPPENKSLWNGHRTIRMRSFDVASLQAGDDEILLVNGGTDTAKHPVWIEGPHIYKINGWYYLLCAEGGTGFDHSEVVFRSKTVEGPYVSYEGNPILTQRHLDPTRKHPITTTGHADLVQTSRGDWYAVFLGCRPYEGDYYNIGRETFLAPVRWKDGWPVITEGEETVKYAYPLPSSSIKPANAFSGNFTYTNDFTAAKLDDRFQFLRTVTSPWYSTTEREGTLCMRLQPETVSGTGNPSFVGFRQSHHQCTATTTLHFSPTAENEKAGLVLLQNEHHFYYLCRSIQNNKPVVQLYQSSPGEDMQLLASQPLPASSAVISLRIEPKGDVLQFSYAAGKKWNVLKKGVDAKFLSTKVAGGFVGSVFGLYATAMGKESKAKACFDSFTYQGNDAALR
jgi:alpha-N-arabinofuranosidase